MIVNWTPTETALYTIKAEVNELDPIPENDHSDNTAEASFVVYNVSEANVLFPRDGFTTSNNKLNFKFIDIGYYINLSLTYYIEIDTSLNFNSPIVSSGPLYPSEGYLNWTTPSMPNNEYFWRVRIFDGTIFGEWSQIKTFSVTNNPYPGFFSYQNGLKLFSGYNINYSDSSGSITLNTSPLAPRPSNETFIEDIVLQGAVFDSVGQTAITTDGTYIYFANIWYFAEQSNQTGKSKIYRVGTGYNGTVKGEFYGALSNFNDRVGNSIVYCKDGYIYIPNENPYYIKRINANTNDTSTIFVPDGLLNYTTGQPTRGSFYLKYDGQYIYNLTKSDSSGNHKYVLRTFDPNNNWQKVREDIELAGSN